MTKRIILSLLCTVMVFSLLSGCLQTTTPTTEQTSVPPTTAPTTAANSPTKETVPVIDDSPYEFTMYVNWGYLGPVGEIYMNNLCEELNLKINYEFPAASGYDDSIALLLATGDLPEVIMMTSETSSVFRDACQDGVFMDISSYLNSGMFPNIVNHTASVSWESLDIFKDGRIWGVPRSSMMRADGYEIRKDWLDAVGISVTEGEPLTLDEMYNILHAFTYNDPDKNGVNDTYGFNASANEFAILFSEAFGISKSSANMNMSTDGWGKYNGEYMCLKYSKTDPSYKEYLAYLNKLWSAGVFDPDTFSIDASTAGKRFNTGVTGVETCFPGNMARKITTLKATNENADLVFVPNVVKSKGDAYSAITTGTGTWFVYSITNEAEKPERILQLMDVTLDDEHWPDLANRGVKGITYDIDANGNVIDLSDKIPDEYKGNKGVMAIVRFLRRSDGVEFFLDVDLTPEDRVRYTNLINLTLDNFIPSLHQGYVPPSASDPNFLDYMSVMNDKIAQIVTGVIPVDEWDKVLEGWYQAGGTTYVKQMQEYISSIMK